MHHRLQKAGDEMLISTKWVTGNPNGHEVSILGDRQNSPFIIHDLVWAALLVPLLLFPVFYYIHIPLELWLVVSGVVATGFLAVAIIVFKKERAARKVYDRFASAGRIHSTNQGSLFYHLKQAVDGDTALLEGNPEKVDAFLMNGTVQEAHKSLTEDPGLSEELKAQLNTTIKTQVDSCVKAIRGHSS